MINKTLTSVGGQRLSSRESDTANYNTTMCFSYKLSFPQTDKIKLFVLRKCVLQFLRQNCNDTIVKIKLRCNQNEMYCDRSVEQEMFGC